MSHTVSLCLAALLCAAVPAVAGEPAGRALWGSINGRKDATKGIFSHHNNKILLSWRKLPGDGAGLAFDLYRTPAGGREVKVNAEPIAGRYNYQDAAADRTVDNTYRLTYHGSDATLSEYTMKAGQASAGLPYISVPLATTTGVNPTYAYLANDASVGDLDGDGICEIVLKRQVSTETTDGGEGAVARDVRHTTLFEAYRLDGTFMWRVCSGPNIPLGNSASFAVADIDPRYPGCEVWWFRGNAHSIDGRDLGYKPASCNMAVWFSGELNRQLLNGTRIDAMNKEVYDRVFTVYRYGVSYVNGTKENPCWYGDMLGDWREELIFPDTTFTKELRIFSTWYPTEHSFPWLMTDHVYHMSAINQNIGYNMPTQLGYYLGSDLTSDDDIASGIEPAAVAAPAADGPCHDLGGRIVDRPGRGIYIRGGKKYVRR